MSWKIKVSIFLSISAKIVYMYHILYRVVNRTEEKKETEQGICHPYCGFVYRGLLRSDLKHFTKIESLLDIN